MPQNIQNRSNKKIKLGQFLTSDEIARFMVALSSKKKDCKALEPCAGKGVFISALLNDGFQDIEAVEYDKEFVILKQKFKSLKLTEGDFLTTGKDEKFDLIIGNPPYVKK